LPPGNAACEISGFSRDSFELDGIDRTNVHTSAAFGTKVRVDDMNSIFDADGLSRTNIDTSETIKTILADEKFGHCLPLKINVI
jgi:hypothetical protein